MGPAWRFSTTLRQKQIPFASQHNVFGCPSGPVHVTHCSVVACAAAGIIKSIKILKAAILAP